MASESFLLRRLIRSLDSDGTGSNGEASQMGDSQMTTMEENLISDPEVTTMSNLDKGKQHLENIKQVIDDVSHKMKSRCFINI